MKSNVLDNTYTDRSPCFLCKYEREDKNECSEFCIALQKYQQGQTYSASDRYEKEEEIMEQKPEAAIPAPIESKEMNEYQKKYTECLIEGCPNKGDRRGLCKEKHYDSWRKGYIEHPVEGLWLPNRKTRPKSQRIRMIVVEKSLKQEKAEYEAAMEKRLEKAKKTRNHGISDEALRNVEPNLDAAVKRIETRYNPQELHTVEEILDETAARIITIDLCKYDKLYNKIMAESERDYVPIEHIIINLLSIGMQVVEGMPLKPHRSGLGERRLNDKSL